jgi:hypothetical protein
VRKDPLSRNHAWDGTDLRFGAPVPTCSCLLTFLISSSLVSSLSIASCSTTNHPSLSYSPSLPLSLVLRSRTTHPDTKPLPRGSCTLSSYRFSLSFVHLHLPHSISIIGTPEVACTVQTLDIADKQRPCIQDDPPILRGGHQVDQTVSLSLFFFSLSLTCVLSPFLATVRGTAAHAISTDLSHVDLSQSIPLSFLLSRFPSPLFCLDDTLASQQLPWKQCIAQRKNNY